RLLYVTNRAEGSISVVSLHTRRPLRKWQLPGGGSPDMGGFSADGRVLWLSGRYNAVVYAIDARTGPLLATIPVDPGHLGLRVVSHVRTRGYGAALRTGLAAARLPYVLLLDGELDVEPAELGRFVAHAGEADLLVGYRLDGRGRSTLRWPSRVRSRVARSL